jgi:hypothetical protein
MKNNNVPGTARFETAGRFVEEQNRRRRGEFHGNGQPLALTKTQTATFVRADQCVRQTGQLHVFQNRVDQDVAQVLALHRGRIQPQPGRKEHRFPHRQFRTLHVELFHVPAAPTKRGGLLRPPIQPDFARHYARPFAQRNHVLCVGDIKDFDKAVSKTKRTMMQSRAYIWTHADTKSQHTIRVVFPAPLEP